MSDAMTRRGGELDRWMPEIPLASDTGTIEVTDEFIVRAPAFVLQEFERELLGTARRLRLDVRLRRDFLRRTVRFTWSPAADPRDIGIWKVEPGW